MKRTTRWIIQSLQQIVDRLPKGYRRSSISKRIIKLKLKYYERE